jgi:hypothetical protein
MLEIDAEAAHGELKPQPMDFAFPPRDYQRPAVQTVEVHLAPSWMMDLGAISVEPVDSANEGYGWYEWFDQTPIFKESCCAGSADPTIRRDQDLTRTKGNGISRVFPGNLWQA